ncbi:MAG: Rpp14/Pop5 family protein [Thermoplasmata archaeon]
MSPKSPGEKWRYVAFKIDSGGSFARSDFLNAMLSSSKGTALENSFRITVFEGDFGIIKVPHKLKDEALSVLASIRSIRGTECAVVPLKTSGTIKTLKEKYRDLIGEDDERTG